MADARDGTVVDVVTRLWRETLGVRDVDPDVGFFQLGGESIAAARIVGRLRTELGVHVSAAVVYDNVTLNQLISHADHLMAGPGGTSPGRPGIDPPVVEAAAVRK